MIHDIKDGRFVERLDSWKEVGITVIEYVIKSGLNDV